MLYVGLDWHNTTSTCHILDANGRRVNARTIKGHRSRTVEYLRSIKNGRPMAIDEKDVPGRRCGTTGRTSRVP